MSLAVWVVALVALFFIARAWFAHRDQDDEALADLVPPPHGEAIEQLVWPVIGETQLNDDHSSRQEAIAKCVEGEPVKIDFKGGGPGGVPSARVVSDHGEIGNLRKDALEKMRQLKKHGQHVEAFIRELEGGTEENRIRSATLQIYVYKDKPHR